MKTALLAIVSFLLCPVLTFAVPTPKESLLVLSKGAHTLAIVDPTNLKVIARMPVGDDPHEVIASSNGKLAYVSNYGFGSLHTLAVLDLANQTALPSIDLGPLSGPHGLAFANGKLWFTAEGAKAIGHYDPPSQKVDWILGTGQNRTHMIWIAPDLKRIVTANVASATMSIIDQTERQGPPGRRALAGTDWNETVVPVGRGCEGFDVSPDGKEIWVANAQDGTISIIDMGSKRVIDTLNANVGSANRLKFTPDGTKVFVSRLADPNVSVFDAHSRKLIKTIPLGAGSAGIEVQPGGARVYIASTSGNYVAVIDPATLAIVGRIDAGPQPDGLAWAVTQ